MPGLDSYLVSLGVKGQDVVLSTMEKIRKKGGSLAKKKIDVKMSSGKVSLGSSMLPEKSGKQPSGPSQKAPFSEEEKKKTDKFGKSVDKFNQTTNSFTHSVAAIDPLGSVQGVTKALGEVFSGVSILGVSLGKMPEGIANLANASMSMAKSAVDMAKQSTAESYNLSKRNAAAAYYGGNAIEKGAMSNNEKAMLVATVSGSFGKIQAPLAEAINKLSSSRDTAALARVSAGDWQSTGTDKGWMIQQLANSFQGLPPSIAQKFQASLLQQYGQTEIQENAPGQKENQRQAAAFTDIAEAQSQAMYKKANFKDVVSVTEQLNKMQMGLYSAGMQMTSAVDASITAISKLPQTIDSMKKALDEVSAFVKAKLPSSVGSKLRIGQ